MVPDKQKNETANSKEWRSFLQLVIKGYGITRFEPILLCCYNIGWHRNIV